MPTTQKLNEDLVFILERQSTVLESKKTDSDDYVLEGTAAVFGKEAGGDIKQNKKTFLLIRALETANPEQLKTLNVLLSSDPADKVEQVLAIFKACKVDAWAEDLKQKYMQEALGHLEAIAVVETRKKPLIDLANYLMNRIQ